MKQSALIPKRAEHIFNTSSKTETVIYMCIEATAEKSHVSRTRVFIEMIIKMLI
jgi:hypothetical protein